MQKLFDEAQTRLTEFLGQRQHVAMVVSCSQTEAAYVLNILNAIEQGDCPDVFWTFPFDFRTPAQFVSQSADTIQASIDMLQDKLAEAGEPKLPPVPNEVFDDGASPVHRMRGLMTYARQILPAPDSMLVVFSLFPLEIQDRHAYLGFVHALMQHAMPRPWCRGMRIFLRDDVQEPILRDHRERLMRTEWFATDFSQPAIEQALIDEALDESLPLPRRMQAFTMVAAYDQAHQRYEGAIHKYELVKRYYKALGNHLMVALALNGIGEVFLRTDNSLRAREYFEKALTPSIEGKAYSVLLNIIMNLGHVSRAERRYADGASYYEQASKLALEFRNVEAYALCIEHQGVCELEQNRQIEAVAVWMGGAAFAREVEAHTSLARLLTRLRDVLSQLGVHDRLQQTEQELRGVEAKLAQEYPSGAPPLQGVTRF